jgi:hypothetical protein
MFCASVRRTPQLVIGGRSPSPRNDSAVSPRIIPGIKSVAEAIRWLMNAGIMWRQITRHGEAPIISAAATKSSARTDSSFDRTARPSPDQSRRPRMRVMPK